MVYVLIVGLLFAGTVHAQTTDVLTNNSIIKMVKAKLTDALIIDVIQTSIAEFDLSNDAIKNLTIENVTPQVIEAMKSAVRMQAAKAAAMAPDKSPVPDKETSINKAQVEVAPAAALTVPATADQKSPAQVAVSEIPPAAGVQTQPRPLTPETQAVVKIIEPAPVVEALSYVAPLKELVTFYERECESMSAEITRWDRQIRDSVEAINKINVQILQVETELREKKNADSRKYSSDIQALKTKLLAYRGRYKQAKNNMLAGGMAITKKLNEISNEKSRAINNQYSEVRQLVKSANPDPAKVGNAVPITFSRFKPIQNTTKYIAPATEMLVWHQNEVNELQGIVVKWNARVKEIIQKDAELSRQLEPLSSKLDEYKSNSKMYKTEIAALKKQKSAIEKQRKLLANKMEDDSNELADYLKQIKVEIQNSAEERFIDIIGNINYLYQEKLTL